MSPATPVVHLPAASRFEIASGPAVARLEYQLDPGRMTIHHTFVPEALRGQRLAGQLAAAAFDFARAEGLRVRPQCSYIAAYAQRHPTAQALVD